MLIHLSGGGIDSGGEDRLRFGDALLLHQHLGIHEITWYVVGMIFDQRAEMFVCGDTIFFANTFHGQAITRESVIWILRKELFELFAAGFLLVGHSSLSYYTGGGKIGRTSEVEKRRDEKGGDEK